MTFTTVVDLPFELSSLVQINLVFSLLILSVQNILFIFFSFKFEPQSPSLDLLSIENCFLFWTPVLLSFL